MQILQCQSTLRRCHITTRRLNVGFEQTWEVRLNNFQEAQQVL